MSSSEDDSSSDSDKRKRFERKFSYHSEDSEFWLWNRREDFSDSFTDSNHSDGYDCRQDDEKEECAEDCERIIEGLKQDLSHESYLAQEEYSRQQVDCRSNFDLRESRSLSLKGKILSLSNSLFLALDEGEEIEVNAAASDEDRVMASVLLTRLESNGKMFRGTSETRQRIDIDTILQVVFAENESISFEIEGNGVTRAGGKIDYIVYRGDERIGVIEAKNRGETLNDHKKQLFHEMMACNSSHNLQFTFGILTEGRNWDIYFTDYKTVNFCGTYSAVADADIFVAVLRSIILGTQEFFFKYFYNPYVSSQLYPIVQSLHGAEQDLEYNTF